MSLGLVWLLGGYTNQIQSYRLHTIWTTLQRNLISAHSTLSSRFSAIRRSLPNTSPPPPPGPRSASHHQLFAGTSPVSVWGHWARPPPRRSPEPAEATTSISPTSAGAGAGSGPPEAGDVTGRGQEVRQGRGMSPRVERLFDIGPPPLDESSGNDTGRCDVIVLPREFGQTSRCA